MTCNETDYLREFDFLDFPIDDKLFNPVPQISANTFQTAQSSQHYSAWQQHNQASAQFGQQYNYRQHRSHSYLQPLPHNPSHTAYGSSYQETDFLPNVGATNAVGNVFDFAEDDLLQGLHKLEQYSTVPSFGLPAAGHVKAPMVDLESLRAGSDLNSSSDTIALFEARPKLNKLKRERDELNMGTTTKKRKMEGAGEVSSVNSSVPSMKFKTKQKRTKWLRKEVQSLWEGIAMYGNNWRLIKKKAFAHRTYYQVKDKGRRILSTQGWSSGRTKATHDGAAEEAKMIAERVLMMTPNTKVNVGNSSNDIRPVPVALNDITSNVGSGPDTNSSDRDTELDFDLEF